MRLLFALTLAIYGFTATDMHTWVRVPQVLLHILEHHSSFGHHHAGAAEHGHEAGHGHNPFGHDKEEACASTSWVSLPAHTNTIHIAVHAEVCVHVPVEKSCPLASYTGSKWNPPRLG